jgi:hypothetical protein
MGCARPAKAPAAREEKPAWIKPAWGPETEGLRCRLRPVRRVWQAGEAPVFKVDLRNGGKRVFAFVSSEPLPVRGVFVDDRARPWPRQATRAGKNQAFGPGAEFTDLLLSLPADMFASLATGRHVVQVVFSFEEIELASNPVTIEIVRGS